MSPNPTPEPAPTAESVRLWNAEDPDIDASDYIIGSVLGWWQKDDESLAHATAVTVAQVLVLGGLSADDAIDKAFATVFPEDGSEKKLGIRVQRVDGKYEVQFDFAEAAQSGDGSGAS